MQKNHFLIGKKLKNTESAQLWLTLIDQPVPGREPPPKTAD